MLDVGGNRCCILGIWGTAGIGKTTIAKAVFNSIAHKFEGSCFLENVRENSMSHGGLLQLQKRLLEETLGGKNLKLNSVDRGISVIKQNLSSKKVLLILDDVNQLDQLKKLAGAESWFGHGSKVIITTRDRGLLTRHGIELIYKVKKLDYQQALELFSLNAFGMSAPPDDYLELSKHAIAYAQHLPLALTLLGSHLSNESVERWRAKLDCYEGDPFDSIHSILRISYDALAYRVQQVFLDIACFFKGQKKDYVIQLLQCFLKNPEDCIQELVQKAIITIELDRILMHDLLEQMGKDIVHEESPTEPGERSRLWFHEDVCHVLKENTGTNKVRGIMIKFPEPGELHLTAKSFSGMTNLGIFINRKTSLYGEAGFVPNKLRMIDWENCEWQSLPSNLPLNELVVFNMPNSRIRQLGEPSKNLSKLTSLNLSGCEFLTKIPDLSGSPNLKYLDLTGCTSLIEVDASVGFLPKLLSLDLEGCYNLAIFPTRISLKSLTRLRLGGCTSLKIFPEIEDKMEFMINLQLHGSGIRELPSSISYLTGLQDLDTHNISIRSASTSQSNSNISQGKQSLLVLPKLNSLVMEEGSLSKSDFLVGLDCWSTLRILYLFGGNFVNLPAYITKFVNLEILLLSCCSKLREIPKLPPKVGLVWVSDCRALENFPKLFSLFEPETELHGLESLQLMNCPRLCANNGYDLARIEFLLLNQHSNDFEIVVPGSEVPKWFNYRWEEAQNLILEPDNLNSAVICEVSIKIPRNVEWQKSGLAVCVVFESPRSFNIHGYPDRKMSAAVILIGAAVMSGTGDGVCHLERRLVIESIVDEVAGGALSSGRAVVRCARV
ncbi:hypothetical protein M0R45_014487 [Rubus argutus]|uniref:TMV resistance protein N-like n=1 Tax=Rubus argutus TaxID=59490 RepID=A0AAW1XLX8_RUBAR